VEGGREGGRGQAASAYTQVEHSGVDGGREGGREGADEGRKKGRDGRGREEKNILQGLKEEGGREGLREGGREGGRELVWRRLRVLLTLYFFSRSQPALPPPFLPPSHLCFLPLLHPLPESLAQNLYCRRGHGLLPPLPPSLPPSLPPIKEGEEMKEVSQRRQGEVGQKGRGHAVPSKVEEEGRREGGREGGQEGGREGGTEGLEEEDRLARSVPAKKVISTSQQK